MPSDCDKGTCIAAKNPDCPRDIDTATARVTQGRVTTNFLPLPIFLEDVEKSTVGFSVIVRILVKGTFIPLRQCFILRFPTGNLSEITCILYQNPKCLSVKVKTTPKTYHREIKMKKILAITAFASISSGAALAEEVLHVYNWSDYIAEDTIALFENATGIKVTYDVYDSNEILEAKLLAGNSGYDVVVPTADFMQRQIAAGVYAELDKSKLPNLKHMDPALMAAAAQFDPDNAHGTIHMWGTTGLGYNIDKVQERLGDDAPTDSWALLFDPANAEKLQDCGIALLDAPVEVLPAAMNYLGLNPQSTNKDDLEKGAELVNTIRPFVRYFHSSQYISDLANGDICLTMGWSGDVFQARDRASEAENGVEVGYSIPKEGALQWFDMLAIPVDAPNKDAAHKFINFMMDPQITANNTNYVWYANANLASFLMVDAEITGDSGIFPPDEVKARLWSATVYNKKTDRIMTRLWTGIKTGQ